MSAGKSASKHLPLLKWKQNMQPILAEINKRKWYATAGDELYTTVRNGWLEHLDARQAFSGPRIKVLYPEDCMLSLSENEGFCVRRNTKQEVSKSHHNNTSNLIILMVGVLSVSNSQISVNH